MVKNRNLRMAKAAKNDEFYTQLKDIEKELSHYRNHFYRKIVFCNCDDPASSNFWRYFHMNFSSLGLKKLISTHYDADEPTYKMEYEGGDDDNIESGIATLLNGNGDFCSQECIDLLNECDIVVTNPSFSIARKYVNVLMQYDKKFIIVGDLNWITYQEIFPLLRDNRIWLGYGAVKEFLQPDGRIRKFGNKLWYTNLDIEKRHEKLVLLKSYESAKYTVYENYDAINVDRTSDIPYDYKGVMGVPITFLNQYNPDQFEIIGLGIANAGLSVGVRGYLPEHREYRRHVEHKGVVDGDLYMIDEAGHPKVPYARILIKFR